MADAILSTPVTLNRADGTSREFKRCSPADRIAYRKIFRLYRKYWLAESLRVLGITGDAAVAHLNKLDAGRLRESHVIEWLNDEEGQNEAILLSLRHDKSDATMEDVYALDLDPDDRLTVAAGVFNVPLVPQKPAGAGPLPEGSPPPESGGTGTGAATPASLPDSPAAPTP